MNIRKLACRVLKIHDWNYEYTPSNIYLGTPIYRICKRCNRKEENYSVFSHTDHYKKVNDDISPTVKCDSCGINFVHSIGGGNRMMIRCEECYLSQSKIYKGNRNDN